MRTLSNSREEPESCLKRLEDLAKRVKQTVQNRGQGNFLDKYRIDFSVTQPRYLIGGKLQQHQLEAL